VTIADSLYRNHDDVVLLKYNCAESISTAESTAREAHITATQRQYSLTYLEVCLVNARYPLILSLILLHALVISPPLFFLPLSIISTVRDITAEKLQLQMSLCLLRTAESHVSSEIAQPRDIATPDNFSGDNFCMGLIPRQPTPLKYATGYDAESIRIEQAPNAQSISIMPRKIVTVLLP